ncbi:unnamed protein product [Caretta caretta]
MLSAYWRIRNETLLPDHSSWVVCNPGTAIRNPGGELRHREAKRLTEGNKGSLWWSRELHPDLLNHSFPEGTYAVPGGTAVPG